MRRMKNTRPLPLLFERSYQAAGQDDPSAAERREAVVNRESPDVALFGARKVALAMAVASAEL